MSELLILETLHGADVLLRVVLAVDGVASSVPWHAARLDADEPRRSESTRNTPRLTGLVTVWHNAALGGLAKDERNGVEDHIGDDTGDKTVGDRVGEGHGGQADEGGESVSGVVPVDVDDGLHHHGSDEDQSTASGPWWDRGKDGRKEDGDEEADTGEHGSKTSLAAFRDTSTRLDVGGDWRRAEEGTDGDRDGIDGIGDGRTLEILGLGVDEATETGHGVEGTGTIKDIDVQEGDEGKRKLATSAGEIPLDDIEGLVNLVESNNLLEEVETGVSKLGLGEVGDGSWARPGDDGYEEDTSNDSALDTVHHEDGGEDTTTEDTDPESGVLHLVAGTNSELVLELIQTTSKLNWGSRCTGNNSDTSRIRITDEGEVKTNTSTGSELDGCGDGTGEPLTESEEGETDENETFDKYSGQGKLVADWASSVESNDLIGEIGIETHTRSEGNWDVCEETHEKGREGGNGGGGSDEISSDNCDTVNLVFLFGHRGASYHPCRGGIQH